MNDTNKSEALDHQPARVKVTVLSIGVGALVLALKWLAYRITHSSALGSDALESIVNVIAALFAMGAVIFAGKPADRDHPYGHGKIEFFSAAFEGGLISLASVMILYEGVMGLIQGPSLRALDYGLVVSLVAGLINGVLGMFLVRSGKKLGSKALEADGHHVVSDFYTTLGILAGLLLVRVTHLQWLDPVMALGVGVLLLRTGFRLVKESADALLDAEDPTVLRKIIDVINGMDLRQKTSGQIITVHALRTMRAGRFTHVDVHVVVPEFIPVREAHDRVDAFGLAVIEKIGMEGEFHTHLDPCARRYCSVCEEPQCSIRVEAFRERKPLTVEDATHPGPDDEPGMIHYHH